MCQGDFKLNGCLVSLCPGRLRPVVASPSALLEQAIASAAASTVLHARTKLRLQTCNGKVQLPSWEKPGAKMPRTAEEAASAETGTLRDETKQPHTHTTYPARWPVRYSDPADGPGASTRDRLVSVSAAVGQGPSGKRTDGRGVATWRGERNATLLCRSTW
jgi:hypothetical protein